LHHFRHSECLRELNLEVKFRALPGRSRFSGGGSFESDLKAGSSIQRICECTKALKILRICFQVDIKGLTEGTTRLGGGLPKATYPKRWGLGTRNVSEVDQFRYSVPTKGPQREEAFRGFWGIYEWKAQAGGILQWSEARCDASSRAIEHISREDMESRYPWIKPKRVQPEWRPMVEEWFLEFRNRNCVQNAQGRRPENRFMREYLDGEVLLARLHPCRLGVEQEFQYLLNLKLDKINFERNVILKRAERLRRSNNAESRDPCISCFRKKYLSSGENMAFPGKPVGQAEAQLQELHCKF
jgi:hypothetical protein